MSKTGFVMVINKLSYKCLTFKLWY